MKCTVEVKMSGFGSSKYEDFEITEEEIKTLAEQKAKETYSYESFTAREIHFEF